MIKLNKIQLDIARQLIITVEKKEPNVSYKELAERLTPPIHHRNISPHLFVIAERCNELNIPIITAKVINNSTHIAGDGLYKLYTQYYPEATKMTPKEVFKNECKKIREFKNWELLLNDEAEPQVIKTNMEGEIIKQIRILPMSRVEEFEGYDIEDLQKHYFKGYLAKQRNGKYFFRTSGMKTVAGSLILFQYEGSIVASAELVDIENFEEKVDGLYSGAYYFDVKSIRTFQPISFDELSQFITDLKPFSQVKQVIEYHYFDSIIQLIQLKESPILADEILDIENEFYEGTKKQITVNKYERDPRAREVCISCYGSNCYICGFDFSEVYGKEYKGKIHVHHIVPLNVIGKEYVCNPINDLRPVCPNCHLVLHANVNGQPISIEELKQRMKERVREH
jgi:hypothetical protein